MKKLGANLHRIMQLSTPKNVIKYSKVWFRIRDPRSGKTYSGSRIQRVKNAPDPGSGTFVFTILPQSSFLCFWAGSWAARWAWSCSCADRYSSSPVRRCSPKNRGNNNQSIMAELVHKYWLIEIITSYGQFLDPENWRITYWGGGGGGVGAWNEPH